jgi:hypothetical protein
MCDFCWGGSCLPVATSATFNLAKEEKRRPSGVNRHWIGTPASNVDRFKRRVLADGVICITALEAPANIAGLDDIAMVGQALKECGRHLGVGEDGRPFTEVEVGGEDDRGALLEPADWVEQELAAGLGEGQTAEFVEDDEVEMGQVNVERCGTFIGHLTRRSMQRSTSQNGVNHWLR